MDNADKKRIAASGMMYQMLEKILVNGVQFIIYVILARLLEPGDFGLVAIISVFVVISNLLVNSGLGTALIQKEKTDEIDFASVLYTSLAMAGLLYAVIFAIAPLVAQYYHNLLITNTLRLYALSIIFFSLNGVQRSILLRRLEFRKVFLVNTLPMFIAGATGIALAYLGFGVYALVFNAVINGLVCVIVNGILLRWKPKLIFSFQRVKKLYSYSYKLLLANLIDTGYINLFPLVIGKLFSSTILGFYNYGRQIPNLIASSINSSIVSVVFPMYSRSQNDAAGLKDMVRKSLSLSSFVIFPLMAGLSAVARPLIDVVLTAKWLPSVPYVQMFCIVYGLYHLQNINFQAISAIGRSDVFLKYEIYKILIGLAILIAAVPLGITWIVVGQILTIVLSIIISVRPNRKLLDYRIGEQLSDYMPPLILSLLMFILVNTLGYLPLASIPLLIVQIIAGLSFYLGMSKIFKLRGYASFKSIMKMYTVKRTSGTPVPAADDISLIDKKDEAI